MSLWIAECCCSGRANNTGGFRVNFDFNSSAPYILKALAAGEAVEELTVKITTVFDATADMTIGFPSNPSAIVSSGEVDMETVGEYKFFPYRVQTAPETLTMYLSGTSPIGVGIIFVEQ